MTYTAQNCRGIRVHVEGPTPEVMDRRAVNLAISFFGKAEPGFLFGIEPYVANPMEVVRDGSGTILRVSQWEADVTVTYRQQAPRFKDF